MTIHVVRIVPVERSFLNASAQKVDNTREMANFVEVVAAPREGGMHRTGNLLLALKAACLAVAVAAGGCAPLSDHGDHELTPPPVGLASYKPPREGTLIRPAGLRAPVAIQQAQALAPPEPRDAGPATIDDFVSLAVARNPRIARATIAIDAARGRHIQAGLYPNPDLAVTWDEIGDRSSPDRLGILTAPKVTQTLVTGGKLTLTQAVAAREVNAATLELVAERYAVIGSVRATFYEVYALQRRAEILNGMVKLSEESVAIGKTLLEAKPAQIARLDFIQLEVERERLRAELQSVRRELPGAYRRLAAVAGDHALIPERVTGTFDSLPAYDPDRTREAVLAFHPQVRSARVNVEKAQVALRRAEVEPIPNLSVYTGFIRQFENRSYDGAVGVSMPMPVWNRNQGNIRAARAELGMAIQAVGQAENDLASRIATTFQTYESARARADSYRKELIPRAEETYRMSLAAFKGGQFEYLRVIQAQRVIAEARLDYNKSMGEAWRAAAELSGLLLEESWPNATGDQEMPEPLPPDVKGP